MRFFKALVALIIVGAVVGVAAAFGGWLLLKNEVVRAGPSDVETTFIVEPGEPLGAIAARLEQKGLVRNDKIVRLHARFGGHETSLKAGEYAIPPRASISAILDLLESGKVIQYRVTVPEGRTTAQVLKIIEASPELTGDLPETPPAEGSLLPDTYLFSTGTTRIAMIERMQQAQTDLIDSLWDGRQDGLPFDTKEEAIILASVVEKETGLPAERPEIAGLFVNRLKKGMRLESDPTVIYGVSKGEPLMRTVNGRLVRRTLYRSELDRVTDWNTYQMDGLPKSPICNPGRDAIAAVLDPPETEYIFFVADGTGGHLFSTTLAEHNRNVRDYRAYEREEIARERAEPDAEPEAEDAPADAPEADTAEDEE